MKKFVIAVLVVMLSCGVGFASVTEDPNFTKTYESKKGAVTFNHETHAVAYDCMVCHESDPTPVVDKTYGHKTCKSCHKALEVETAPTKCNGCHVKE